MGLCNKSETISNILKLRTISKPKKDQAQGGLFGHHPKRSKKNEDVCLRNGLLVTCLRMFWVRKFNTHFVCRVLWQETCWYKIQLILPPRWNSSLPTLLSPNRFSMFFDASTYFSRLAICQASSYGYGLLVSETTWSSARSPRGFFPARLSDLPICPSKSLDLSPSLALIHLNGRQRIALCSLGAKMLAEIRSG